MLLAYILLKYTNNKYQANLVNTLYAIYKYQTNLVKSIKIRRIIY